MYCKKCGAYNLDGISRCITCGNQLTIEVAPHEHVQQHGHLLQHEPAAQQPMDNYNYTPLIQTPPVQEAAPIPERVPMPEITYIPSEIPSPPPPVQKTHASMIKDYFVPSILVAIFCSMTFGIAALIFSVMTSAAKKSKNSSAAAEYSVKTKAFCWIGFAIGVVRLIIVILYSALLMSVLKEVFTSNSMQWF